MAKLYFRYGTVGSAKTLNLLAVAHNYEQQGKKILTIKPAIDTRFGLQTIRSRAGLECEADILLEKETDLSHLSLDGVSCILVDEAQFLTPSHIDQIRQLVLEYNVPAICYGLRSDFKSRLFPGSLRLMEIADSIEEVKSTCFYCNSKGTQNLKYVNGRPTVDGPSVELGAEEKYHPACFACYQKKLRELPPVLKTPCHKEELAFV